MTDTTDARSTADLAKSIIGSCPDVRYRTEDGVLAFDVPPQRIRDVVALIERLVPDVFPENLFGVDLQDDKYEVIYYFWSRVMRLLIQLRVQLQGASPSVASVCDIFPALEWYERETHEMFGIDFAGHPDLRLLLLPDELEGKYPLRKSFKTDRSRLNESGLAAGPSSSGEG